MIHSPLDGGNDIAPGTACLVVQHLEGVQSGLRRHAHHAVVVIFGGNSPGYVGAVAVIVHGDVVVVHEVVPTRIIGVKVGVGVVDAGVDHGHLHAGSSISCGVIETRFYVGHSPSVL